MSKQPPPAPTASTVGPCPTIIQIVGRPGTGSLPRTIAPPDHPHGSKKRDKTILSFFAAQPAEKKAKGNQASESDASDPDTSENTEISTDQPIESQSGARNDEPKMKPQIGQKVERNFRKQWLRDFPWLKYDSEKKNHDMCSVLSAW